MVHGSFLFALERRAANIVQVGVYSVPQATMGFSQMANHVSHSKSDPKATDQTRREFVQKVAYIAPLVTTLHASPSFARGGSPPGKKGDDWGDDWGDDLGDDD